MSDFSEMFDACVIKHIDPLRKRALILCKGNLEDAEDLLQASIIRMLQHKENFTMGTNFGAWSQKILYRTFVNLYRRHKNYQQKIFPTFEKKVLQEQEGRDLHPLDDLHFNELLGILEKELNENFFDVLLLVDVEGLSYKDTADKLGVPLGTVMSRLYRARRNARDAILDYYNVGCYDSDILEDILEQDKSKANK